MYKYCFECQKTKTKNNNSIQHVLNLYFSGNSINNLLSYCGLTDARMSASEKDLPVSIKFQEFGTLGPICQEFQKVYAYCMWVLFSKNCDS